MPIMSTCLARLGSRYSMILDPIRQQVKYGALGLFCQSDAELVIGLDDGRGNFDTLPLCKTGQPFFILDQALTMTSVVFEAYSLKIGAKFTVEIVAPFWPQDELTSIVPAYIVNMKVQKLTKVRWYKVPEDVAHKGVVRIGLKLPGAKVSSRGLSISLEYSSEVPKHATAGRSGPFVNHNRDLISPLTGTWAARGGMLEAKFDVSGETTEAEFSAVMAGYCGDATFEDRHTPMKLKYVSHWSDASAVADFVRANRTELLAKSRKFDALWSGSSLPASAADLTATSFQSYLMCSLWAGDEKRQWFSVWEGSCWFNSTVDVTYNEAMFYFACWPELLEMIFQEWAHHANNAAEMNEFTSKRAARTGAPAPDKLEFAGKILMHDMGVGWAANGEDYTHPMPVEENSNFLLLLYAHGKWWGREKLFKKYADISRSLVEYLMWSDSKGNGFPDRGTANTIDDATPAVQYGRDNVYLGIKRLAALHAAGKMFQALGESDWARRCAAEVRKAVKTLNAAWLGDHWGVCLDKSAKGLLDAWTGQPLPYKTLAGWDAYSLYTTNGLLPLMMIDDLPPGISRQRLAQDAVNACRASMTRYGCGHSSLDKTNMWVSMNVWRDCAAAYLGANMLENNQRYWNQQLFANGPGSEKANCFTETSLTNDLVWYPRGAATFGLPMAIARLKMGKSTAWAQISPIADGRWPLLALANWKTGIVPFAIVETTPAGKRITRIEGRIGRMKLSVK